MKFSELFDRDEQGKKKDLNEIFQSDFEAALRAVEALQLLCAENGANCSLNPKVYDKIIYDLLKLRPQEV
jgi:hypothetical protein